MKYAIALTMIALFCAATAGAQTVHMSVSVPFQFQIDRQTFPAADYRIEYDKVSGGMILRSKYGSAGVFLASVPAFRPGRLENRGGLEFRRYGNSFFLHKVWVNGSGTGRQLIPSATERHLARAAQKSTDTAAGGTQ